MLIFISNMFRRRLRRGLRKLIPLALVAALSITVVFVHALLFLSTVGQTVEIKQTDFWFRLRGAVHVPEELALVSIDESTYRELSLSTLAPLPRGVVADLLESLAESGASLAIVDFFLGIRGMTRWAMKSWQKRLD